MAVPDFEEPYLYIRDVRGLIALVQMGVVEIHPWGAQIDRPNRPDRVVFDLDPGPGDLPLAGRRPVGGEAQHGLEGDVPVEAAVVPEDEFIEPRAEEDPGKTMRLMLDGRMGSPLRRAAPVQQFATRQ